MLVPSKPEVKWPGGISSPALRSSPCKPHACAQAPKTDFSAVAVAVKDVAARNAALASTQSEGRGASSVAGASSGWAALRDPPESGAPTDETDRRAPSALLRSTPCHPHPSHASGAQGYRSHQADLLVAHSMRPGTMILQSIAQLMLRVCMGASQLLAFLG